MTKHIYLAGKLDSAELKLNSVASELESRGHKVLEKWFENEKLPLPYLSNMPTSTPAAAKMIQAAAICDVFILFAADKLLGAAVEFGAALGSATTSSSKLIIVIYQEGVRQSIFYTHPRVIVISGMDELRKLEWY